MQISNSADRLSESQFNDSSYSSNGRAKLTRDMLDVTAGFRSKPAIQVGGLVIEYLIAPPSELETLPISHHFLMFNLTEGTRQVNQIDGGEYDGSIKSGDFFFLPSGMSASWAWDTKGEGLSFMMNPDFLPHIAATTECLKPDKI